MKIYIAASWKHQHAVEMLTAILKEKGYEVLSFVDNAFGEGYESTESMDFEKWMKTDSAQQAFQYDTTGASVADIVVYIGPSGKDAAAELGIAWANSIPIIGLYGKGEDFGLMRKIIKHWFSRYTEVVEYIVNFKDLTK